LHLPPLRERPNDIELLARHFLLMADGNGRRRHAFSPAALRKLMHYDWPGNVRELSNVVQRAALTAESGMILPHQVLTREGVADPSADRCFRAERGRAIEAFERDFVVRALERCHGNVTQAARATGKERRAFGRLIKKYAIQRQTL
jgi:two-component system response regulator GlrR